MIHTSTSLLSAIQNPSLGFDLIPSHYKKTHLVLPRLQIQRENCTEETQFHVAWGLTGLLFPAMWAVPAVCSPCTWSLLGYNSRDFDSTEACIEVAVKCILLCLHTRSTCKPYQVYLRAPRKVKDFSKFSLLWRAIRPNQVDRIPSPESYMQKAETEDSFPLRIARSLFWSLGIKEPASHLNLTVKAL